MRRRMRMRMRTKQVQGVRRLQAERLKHNVKRIYLKKHKKKHEKSQSPQEKTSGDSRNMRKKKAIDEQAEW